MASNRLEDIISCSICFEIFNEDSRCPRILSCGHSFCHSCIVKILERSPSCPTCKVSIQSPKSELIPINFSVKSLISVASPVVDQISLPERSSNLTFTSLKSEGICNEHSNYKELRCMDCKRWICGICSALNHKRCRTLLVEEAYKEFKEQISQKVENELESRKKANEDIIQSLESLREKIEKKKKELKALEEHFGNFEYLKSKDGEYCKKLKQLHIEFKNSSNEKGFSQAMNELENLMGQEEKFLFQLQVLKVHCPCFVPSTIEELSKLCEMHHVYTVEYDEEILFGKVRVNDGLVWISNFQREKPSESGHKIMRPVVSAFGQPHPAYTSCNFCQKTIILQLSELLSRFRGASEVPRKAFLKCGGIQQPMFGTFREQEFEIVIETDGISPRAKNFLSLCRGCNEKNQLMCQITTLNFKDSFFYKFQVQIPKVIEESIDKCHEGPCKEGDVIEMKENDSSFYGICLRDCPEDCYPKLGFVISGLQKLHEYIGRSFTVLECGLVI